MASTNWGELDGLGERPFVQGRSQKMFWGSTSGTFIDFGCIFYAFML